MIPPPLAGVYPFDAATSAGDIVIYEGGITVHHGGKQSITTGRIRLALLGGIDLRWQVESDLGLRDLASVELEFARPDIGTVRVPANTTHSTGAGFIQHADLGTEDDIEHVLVHWFNLPQFLPSDPLSSTNGTYAGRWTLDTAGWRLTLDQRADRTAAVDTGRQLGHAVHTHSARLERPGEAFTAEEARSVLEALQLALSFALGRWVPPALPVGFNSRGQRVWEEWANYRCSPYEEGLHWWDTMQADDLSAMCTSFLEHCLDPARHDPLRHAVMHAVSSSSDRTTLEARVMLAQAGIEYLAWVNNVLEGTASRSAYYKLNADEKISDMLRGAGIGEDIPTGCEQLLELVPSHRQTGPQAVTWLRNRLVHPKDASEPYRVEGALTSCWHLSLEYLELLILSRIDYQGTYLPRTVIAWAHDSRPVPWADKSH